ncbi:MAG: prepilin-type N-terminal cleavage/methylation domain-containing protein [Gemmatimonadetes bacterium]|nr:MAG: prepilin-type N-terminal cleavage/methylation domain-containing protein [Gemmatimonadota bacterium]
MAHDDEAGFTLLEMVVVVLLIAVTLSIASGVFAGYQARTAAQRAAKVFGRDLALARTSALRARETAVVRFDEANRLYTIELPASGTTIVRRAFGQDADVPLDTVDLRLQGDTLAFSSRGVGDLTGAGGALGVARFVAGGVAYEVSFNSMGAARVQREG